MNDEPVTLVCMQVRDYHNVVQGSDFTHRCSKCGEPLAIAPSGQRVLAAFPDVVIICNRCFKPDAHEPVQLVPGAVEEAIETLLRKVTH